MNIEIKKSIKPIKYNFAINLMEKRVEQVAKDQKDELIWTLEHDEVYTGGTSYKDNEILDKSIITSSLPSNTSTSLIILTINGSSLIGDTVNVNS